MDGFCNTTTDASTTQNEYIHISGHGLLSLTLDRSLVFVR